MAQGGRLLFSAGGTLTECNPSGTKHNFNPNYQWLTAANGTDNNNVGRFAVDSRVEPTADFYLTPDTMPVLTAVGVGATLIPQTVGITLLYQYPEATFTHTDCFGDIITVALTPKGVWSSQIKFCSSEPPTGGGGATGAAPSGIKLKWTDTTAFATPGSATLSTDLKAFSVTVNRHFVVDDSPRGDGFATPFAYTPGPNEITFSVTVKQRNATLFGLAVAACPSIGDITVGATTFCDPTATLSLALHNAQFEVPGVDGNIGAIVAQTYSGTCSTPGGANPVELSVS